MSHQVPSLKLIWTPAKWMVGTRSFSFGAKGLFSGANSLLVSGSVVVQPFFVSANRQGTRTGVP